MGVLVPEVPVTLDRPRRFIETLNALARWEEVTGLNSRRPDVFVSMVPSPMAPCPTCGDEEGAAEAPEDLSVPYTCAACGATWPRVEHRQNLNHGQWSAYVWALLLEDDPEILLEDVRTWLGDPQVYANVEVGVAQLQLAQFSRAMTGAKAGSASEGDPPPGPTSGRPDASTSG